MLFAAALVAIWPATAHADDAPLPAAPGAPPRRTHLRDLADLDGTYLWLGPIVAATVAQAHADARGAGDGPRWDSAAGAEIAVTRIREQAALGCLGVLVGGERLATGAQGRVWGGISIGSRGPLGLMAGIEASALLSLAPDHSPRPGASLGLWLFAGVTPYVRAGVIEREGTFAELGVRILLPAKRW